MAFKDRLKEARLQNKLTQEQVATQLGIAKSTFTGYEKGNSEPSMNTISKIMSVLHVDANFLWQDEMDERGGNPMSLKYKEMEHIKKYRDLDDHGTDVVDSVLNLEYVRVTASSDKIREITYYRRQASAGTGQVLFDDTFAELIPIPDVPEYKRVSYAIGVNGNSMEPVYQDEDILLVETTNEIEHGDIGIFIVGNESFVKELGNEELISLNKDYDNIPLTEDSKCMGRVVGKI